MAVARKPLNLASALHSFVPVNKPVAVEKVQLIVFIVAIATVSHSPLQKVVPEIKALKAAEADRERERKAKYVLHSGDNDGTILCTHM